MFIQEEFMLNQNVLGEKVQVVRNKFRRLFQKAKSKERNPERTEDYEFEPETDRVGTAPRLKGSILSSGTTDAQNLVWDNEDASMQDKSYSFDESSTDADYDTEDDLDFSDDDGNQDGR
jgi:hypothetical protein